MSWEARMGFPVPQDRPVVQQSLALASPKAVQYNRPMFISHTVTFVKALMSHAVRPGDIAVDATVGNGHDTLFLSGQVGEQGHVFGFDIQQEALDSARCRLEEGGARNNVTLMHEGHERMAELLPGEFRGRVAGVMFNLGYLPGGDGQIITRAETTRTAIDAALSVMKKGGILSLVLYTGHPGGEEEAQAVEAHCAGLDMDTARVMRCAMHNHPTAQTRILLLERR
ncbi:class I SAM-dependent methyltransferase [Salidesulfovibrio onnuriiensis]|uniref:class I SAM-dependent methyltransferase n=1 Tax=Salidesulfovibrio onnuriiensis TaxID=2583823 RepID=UPI00202B61A9|nr:class I SAM-dependent methyltransferase [Salidesulfovibrio onnuriiensis]